MLFMQTVCASLDGTAYLALNNRVLKEQGSQTAEPTKEATIWIKLHHRDKARAEAQ